MEKGDATKSPQFFYPEFFVELFRMRTPEIKT
jgi:hypothetical protein